MNRRTLDVLLNEYQCTYIGTVRSLGKPTGRFTLTKIITYMHAYLNSSIGTLNILLACIVHKLNVLLTNLVCFFLYLITINCAENFVIIGYLRYKLFLLENNTVVP